MFSLIHNGVYNLEQSLAISQDGSQIFYTSAVGSFPAEPTKLNQYNSPIPIPVNTNIKAYAWKKGYKPSSTQEITVKIRTPMPNVTVTGSAYPLPNSNLYYSDITLTPVVTGLPSGETVKYYSNYNLSGPENGVVNINDPIVTQTTFTGLTVYLDQKSCRMKLIAKATNMEPSNVRTSYYYRLRSTNLTVENKYIPENGYTISADRTGGPQWKKIASSSTGQYLAAIETSTDGTTGFIWTSSDYGNTWVKQTGGDLGTAGKNWSGIAISGDGNRLLACAQDDFVYYSNNYGATWAIQNNSGSSMNIKKNWSDVSISNNGIEVSAVATDSYHCTATINTLGIISWSLDNNSYSWGGKSVVVNDERFRLLTKNELSPYSNNAGGWTQLSTLQNSWIQCAMSRVSLPSTAVYAIIYGSGITKRIGFGNWSSGVITGDQVSFNGLAINGDGNYMAASTSSGRIYKGNKNPDNSYSWSSISNSPNTTWAGVACNYDFNHIYGIVKNGDIWTSSDGGATWSHPGMRTWTGVACSSYGKYVAACESGYSGGYIHISSNGGANWTQIKKDSNGNSMWKKWKSIDMSNDGSVVVAVSENEMWYSINSGTSWTKAGLTPLNSYEFKKVSCQGVPPSEITKTRVAVITESGTIGSRKIITLDGTQTSAWDTPNRIYNDIFLSDMGDKYAYALSGVSGSYGACGVCELVLMANVISVKNTYGNSTICSSVTGNSDLSKVIFSKRMAGSGVKFMKFVYSGGPQWTELPERTTSHDSIAICGNLDKELISMLNSEQIFTSIDGGSTWTNQTSAGNKGWNCIASTADGLTIFAGGTKQTGIMMLK